jgi:hypothetical protein
MPTTALRSIIISEIESLAAAERRKLPPLQDDLALLDSGLDSLCLALLVDKLEDRLGYDPFTASDEIQLPVTLGDFIELYENGVR